jgi:adenylate cyclase
MARKYNTTGNSRHRPISIRLCEKAVAIDPAYARAWALLAICKSNNVALADGTGDTGWSAAERALALEPNLAEAHAARGRILGDDGHLEESLAEHRIALRLDPENYEVNAAAARCFIALRRHDDAIQCLERAAQAIETDFWALGMSIQCYEAVGDLAGAASAARRALARVEKVVAAEPDHGVALGFGVTALATLGERERAKEWAERALLLDPSNRNLRYNMACAMVTLRDMDTAIELLESVVVSAAPQGLRWFETDNSLDPIREDPRYQALVANAKARLGMNE